MFIVFNSHHLNHHHKEAHDNLKILRITHHLLIQLDDQSALVHSREFRLNSESHHVLLFWCHIATPQYLPVDILKQKFKRDVKNTAINNVFYFK